MARVCGASLLPRTSYRYRPRVVFGALPRAALIMPVIMRRMFSAAIASPRGEVVERDSAPSPALLVLEDSAADVLRGLLSASTWLRWPKARCQSSDC